MYFKCRFVHSMSGGAFMKPKEKNDIVPYYCTLPMLQPDHKTKPGNVTIPQDDDVKITRGWSEDLKL